MYQSTRKGSTLRCIDQELGAVQRWEKDRNSAQVKKASTLESFGQFFLSVSPKTYFLHHYTQTTNMLLIRYTIHDVPWIPFGSNINPSTPVKQSTATSHNHTRHILPTTSPLPSEHLTRRPRKARRHIQCRIPGEEVSRPQQHRHRLSRHDREILWAGEMDNAKGVPEHDIGVGDVLGRLIRDPLR